MATIRSLNGSRGFDKHSAFYFDYFHALLTSELDISMFTIYNLQFKHLADALNPERLTMTG